MPEPQVLIDFSSGPLEVPTSFEAVTARSVEIVRGKAHERSLTEPSRLFAVLSNADRSLDPDNLDGPHWPNVTPMRHVRAEVTLGTTTYSLISAYVEDFGQTWPGVLDAVVPLQATNAFKLLNLAKVAGTRYSHQLYTDTVDDAVVGAAAAHYYLDEASGASSFNDRLGAFDLGTIGSNVTVGDLARPPTYGRPRSVLFGPNDDAGDGLSRTSAPAFASDTSNVFAWMCWLRLDTLPTDGYIVGMRNGSTITALDWKAAGSTGQLHYAGTLWDVTAQLSNVFLADGAWHHYGVRVTIDATADTVTAIFYRDGVSLGSNVAGPDAGMSTPGQLVAINNFFVGGDGGTGGSHGIDGNMAHLLVVNNSAPSGPQIEELGMAVWDHVPQEPAGLQLHAFLDSIGWPLEQRDLDAGTVDMQAFNPIEGDPVLTTMLEIAETSERGLLYVDGSGIVTFRDASSLAARVSEATFGDAGAEIPYQNLETRHDDQDIYNQIAVTSVAGTAYVEDDTSVATYGPRLLALSVRLAVLADVQDLADALLPVYKDPLTRPVRLQLRAKNDATVLEQIFARGQGDRITVMRRPPGGGDPVILDAVIEGSTTRAIPDGIWEGTFDLAPFI